MTSPCCGLKMLDGIRSCVVLMLQRAIILFFSMIYIEILFTWINKIKALFNMLV